MERRITLLSLHKFDSFVLSGMWSDQVSVLANRSRRKSIDINLQQQGLQRIVRADVPSMQEVSAFLCLSESKYCRKSVEKLLRK